VGAAVLVGIVLFSINQANKGVVTVQTAKVAPRQENAGVASDGLPETIKPTTYTNVTAQGFGRITGILVKEGDKLKRVIACCCRKIFRPARDVQAASCVD